MTSEMKNHEGYNDPTAYFAMKNANNKEKEKKEMNIENGDIFTFATQYGEEKIALILKTHKNCNTSTILQLSDDNFPGAIEVKCKGIKYTDTRRIQYVFNDKLCDFVRSLTEEEYSKIMDEVKRNLGIFCEYDSDKYNVLLAEYDAILEENEALKEALKEEKKGCENPYEVVKDNVDIMKESLEELRGGVIDGIRVKAERDVYKDLYESTITKMLESSRE